MQPGSQVLLSLMLMSKSKKALEMSLDLTPLDLTPRPPLTVDTRVKGLASNVDYLENRCRNFIQKKFCSLDCNFSFYSYRLFTPLMALKGKKIINKALSKQCKQFLLPFYFLVKGLSFETQFKIKF